jgi:hypothetical protein
MTTCALINTVTGVVENLVVAKETDVAGDGYILKASPPRWVTIGTSWDGENFVGNGVTTPQTQIKGLRFL